MFPERPDPSVLLQAAQTTKVLEHAIGSNESSQADEINNVETAPKGTQETPEMHRCGQKATSDVDSKVLHERETESLNNDANESEKCTNWLDYVINGAVSREKRRKADSDGDEKSKRLDMAKGGLVKRSKNVCNTTTVGDGGREWRRRLLRRQEQEKLHK
ncbi:hypothetical protein X943_000543 [Babesia divergens]|uniref:Uncharacterized protein n=1 Tax=Babesia divergens TaxID=32595 RepID=A0AAD9G6K5_BABDI|nr:hypothetical protein X943_000543 [Babesia divergens]